MSTYTRTTTYQRCQALFDRRYPNFKNAGVLYKELAESAIDARPNALLLDVGCGRDSLAADAVRKTAVSVGIDLSLGDLPHNTLVTYRAGADAGYLPFRAGIFDVVISQWVVEHFNQPIGQFAEIARVIKPGGRLVVMTTNANNYIALVGRLVPEKLRQFALHRLLRRPLHESFPTFYRANTRRTLQRIGAQAGLALETCLFVGNPFYMAFSVPLFRAALLYERLTDWRALNPLKLYILAVLRKSDSI